MLDIDHTVWGHVSPATRSAVSVSYVINGVLLEGEKKLLEVSAERGKWINSCSPHQLLCEQ